MTRPLPAAPNPHPAAHGEGREVPKPALTDQLFEARGSAAAKYQRFFVGQPGWWALLRYEVVTLVAGPMPGALGHLLRKLWYGRLCGRVGSGVLWGRNVGLRHPRKIRLGDRVAVDDNCLLDARGAGEQGMQIGDDVVIARDTVIQGRTAWVEIGNRCVIGSQCQFSSAGGIKLGAAVMVGGQCYLGGGRHHTERTDIPIIDQGVYTKGPVVIEDNVWLGAGVMVQDGVRIGTGSVIGAGAIIRENIPPQTVVTPHQRLVLLPRSEP